MSNYTLKSALVLTSVSLFGGPWSNSTTPQQAQRPEWSGETTLSTGIASITYRGSGIPGPNYNYNTLASSPAEGSFSTVGLQLKENVSWREWISFELTGAYSRSLGASANDYSDYYDYNALPASLDLWDASSNLSSPIPLDHLRSVCIEPAVGFGLVAANLKAAYANMPTKNWEQLMFYGPTAGLYMRLCLSPKVNLRVGGSYMASRLRIKKYWPGDNNPAGSFAGTHAYRSRRGGLGALAELKYLWKSWVQFHASIDYQSWSAGGKPANYNGPVGAFQVQATTTTPMLTRLRFSWGANFTY